MPCGHGLAYVTPGEILDKLVDRLERPVAGAVVSVLGWAHCVECARWTMLASAVDSGPHEEWPDRLGLLLDGFGRTHAFAAFTYLVTARQWKAVGFSDAARESHDVTTDDSQTRYGPGEMPPSFLVGLFDRAWGASCELLTIGAPSLRIVTAGSRLAACGASISVWGVGDVGVGLYHRTENGMWVLIGS